MTIKGDLTDLTRKMSELLEFRIAESEQELQKYIQDQNLFEAKLEKALREPGAFPYTYAILFDQIFQFFFKKKLVAGCCFFVSGRKNIIAQFKELVASFPKKMEAMQNELSNLKESSSEIHCLRAQLQSLSSILGREVWFSFKI